MGLVLVEWEGTGVYGEGEREREGKNRERGSCGKGCCGKHRGGWGSGERKLRERLLWEA